ncbi:MBL fold metallo-hydrolase [Tautonia sociabilis]|uniref:MBL fold metallo-hydrolase n=1 Tax=Tautonia sociabilis TaxID=2080755 RepID=A0A432MIR2_9BACT|nr:MBL fold metallo-hydrolase [Tautonia sociabilis]RUL87095.1 MBL fold metallo-hydrolase [Tautonia sociabilis]
MALTVYHLNCGVLHAPPNPAASCHCLLLEEGGVLSLVDSGIGLLDVARPLDRLGRELIDLAGFQFDERLTAARQVERLGFRPDDVADIVLSHADPDHTGGLADFPRATVHLSEEEHSRLGAGHPRYVSSHFEHGPVWKTHGPSSRSWFGLEARPVALQSGSEVLLVPLPGHTIGHCGVAVGREGRWTLHVGDAYYLRIELSTDEHPVSALAALRADDDALRRESLGHLRRLNRDHPGAVELLGYHDVTEFPEGTAIGLEPPFPGPRLGG